MLSLCHCLYFASSCERRSSSLHSPGKSSSFNTTANELAELFFISLANLHQDHGCQNIEGPYMVQFPVSHPCLYTYNTVYRAMPPLSMSLLTPVSAWTSMTSTCTLSFALSLIFLWSCEGASRQDMSHHARWWNHGRLDIGSLDLLRGTPGGMGYVRSIFSCKRLTHLLAH